MDYLCLIQLRGGKDQRDVKNQPLRFDAIPPKHRVKAERKPAKQIGE
jgi:hypothetical protein